MSQSLSSLGEQQQQNAPPPDGAGGRKLGVSGKNGQGGQPGLGPSGFYLKRD